MDSAVATIESRRKRRPSGSFMSSVLRLRLPTSCPVAPATMYPAVPKWPMAMLLFPVMRLVHGCAKAGIATSRMPSSSPPTTTTLTEDRPEVARTMVSRVAMKSM